MIDLVILDMAGTTVLDDGLVERAFTSALDDVGLAPDPADRAVALDFVRATMGQSKIVVFTEIAGDAERGAQANAAFEEAYGELLSEGLAEEVPGALAAIRTIQAAGIRVAITTGFSPATREGLLVALGWHGIPDLALSPVDAGGRGRPFPDLNLTALLRLKTSGVGSMVVVGDTVSDMASGVAAGAGRVVGVLTGAHSEERLRLGGATDILPDVSHLPGLLGL